jgi:hypothetical protein
MEKWYESNLREVRSDVVLIHFHGWESKWDEWVSCESDRISPTCGLSGPYHLTPQGNQKEYGTLRLIPTGDRNESQNSKTSARQVGLEDFFLMRSLEKI